MQKENAQETLVEKSPPSNSSAADQPSPQKSPGRDKPKISRSAWLIGSIATLILVAGAAFLLTRLSEEKLSVGPKVSGEQTGPVARVNDQEIPRDQFDFRYRIFSLTAAAQGLDLTNPDAEQAFKQQLIDELVNSELLLQQANEANLAASEEALAAELQRVEASFGGTVGFQQQLVTDGISLEDLTKNIRQQLTIALYVDFYTQDKDLSVTDEAVDQAYTLAAEANDQLPPLELLRQQILDQLTQQKKFEAISSLLKELKSQAEIEILL